MAVLAILGAIVLTTQDGIRERALMGRAEAELVLMSQLLEDYRNELVDYPWVAGGQLGERVLWEALSGQRLPNGSLVSSAGKSSWLADMAGFQFADRSGNLLVEWTALPIDYNGSASSLGFSLFRFIEDDWEANFGNQGSLGTGRPSDLASDWWPAFTVGNILATEIEIGVVDAGTTTVLLSSAQSGTLSFPLSTTDMYSKPDYIKVLLRVLSDDRVNEYDALSTGALDAAALQRWLDANTVTVVWTFDILTDLF
jgi:hypothetical protein|tara:strand:+ start:2170 stop:2934 length:765 start_codon:yes stop_codon:yes gene_type:complete